MAMRERFSKPPFAPPYREKGRSSFEQGRSAESDYSKKRHGDTAHKGPSKSEEDETNRIDFMVNLDHLLSQRSLVDLRDEIDL